VNEFLMNAQPKDRSGHSKRVSVASLLVVLVALNCGCQVSRALKQPIPASPPVGIHDARTERIGLVVRDTMRKEGIPGLSIAVIDRGEIAWAQGFGWRVPTQTCLASSAWLAAKTSWWSEFPLASIVTTAGKFSTSISQIASGEPNSFRK